MISIGTLQAFGAARVQGTGPRLAAVVVLAALAAGSSAKIDETAQRSFGHAVAPHRVALRAIVPRKAVALAPAGPSVYAQEAAMSYGDLMQRWKPEIRLASRRFAIPEIWIHAVMMIESGGRTMMAKNVPIASDAGAMGLMQVMPKTWQRMRARYRLGPDPYAPHDNIMAGAAYLRELYDIYGYPGLFAAYNDGATMLEAHRRLRQMMPAETTAYVWNIASILSTGERLPRRADGLQTETPPAETAPVTARIVVMRKPSNGYDDDYDER